MYDQNIIKEIEEVFIVNDRISIELMDDLGLDEVFSIVYRKLKLFNNNFVQSWGVDNKREHISLHVVGMACDFFEKLQNILRDTGRIISSGALNAFEETINILMSILNRFRINCRSYEETKNKLRRIEVLEAIGIFKDDGFVLRNLGWMSNSEIDSEEKKEAALNYAKDNIEDILKFCYQHGFDRASCENYPEVYLDHMEPQNFLLYERVNSFGRHSFEKKIVREFLGK